MKEQEQLITNNVLKNAKIQIESYGDFAKISNNTLYLINNDHEYELADFEIRFQSNLYLENKNAIE